MPVLRTALARLRALWRRNVIADEIREEMEAHVRLRAEEFLRHGCTPKEAQLQALRRFGNVAVLRDRGYDVRGGGVMETVAQDVRYGLRALRHSLTFTVVALIVLALSTGAGTAIFSVADAVALRGLPYDEHDRIAAVFAVDPKRALEGLGEGQSTTQTYLDWRRLQPAFSALAFVSPTGFQVQNERGEPSVIVAKRVTWEFFPVLRVAPLMGRVFGPDDERSAETRVVIVSYGLWQRRFAGAPDAIGKTLALGNQTWHVVGVLPRDFSYPPGSDKPAELYVPQVFRDQDRARGFGRNYSATVIGRLKTGLSFQAAEEAMNRVAAGLDQQYPDWEPGWRVHVLPLQQQLTGTTRNWMLLLLGAVGLVVLIACANVANLMLARATTRAREIGVRKALGASRARIIRGLLIESLLLSLAGGVIGIGLAAGGVHLLRAWLPHDVPRVSAIAINLRVLVAAIGASVVTGLLFGLAPALQASHPNLARVLKEADRSTSAGHATRRLRHLFVVTEVALATVLLAGAGLFIASFLQLVRIEPGFDYHHTLVVHINVPRNTATQESFDAWGTRNEAYARQVSEAVTRIPGVVAVAGLGNGGLPLTQSWSRLKVTFPAGTQVTNGDDGIDVRGVTPGYFSLLRIPLQQGRAFSVTDRGDAPSVVIVNERAARKYWGGRSPIGEHVTIGRDRVVVGVVGDIRQYGLEKPSLPGAFFPLAQDPFPGAVLLVRTTGDPLGLLPAVKAVIWSINPRQLFSDDVYTLDGYMDRLIAQRRFSMLLVGALGGLGLLIAVVGIFGVLAYVVLQRTREIGIRVALGATPMRIVIMVIRSAVALIISGLVVGGVAAWQLSSLTAGFLFHIRPTDPRIFVAVGVTLLLAGLTAAAIPARRAAAIDPTESLRQE